MRPERKRKKPKNSDKSVTCEELPPLPGRLQPSSAACPQRDGRGEAWGDLGQGLLFFFL